jgi:hypothetical protein
MTSEFANSRFVQLGKSDACRQLSPLKFATSYIRNPLDASHQDFFQLLTSAYLCAIKIRTHEYA